MIGIVDCDIEIYQQISHWLPINHYMHNIYCSDIYWYRRIHYLFPNFPIPKEIKPCIFYQNIIKGRDVKDLIKYTFTLNNEFIYQWLIQNCVDDYWKEFQYQRCTLRKLWHRNNFNKCYINQLLALFLNHYDLICYYDEKDMFVDSIQFLITCINPNDITQACIEKYNIKNI